MRSKYVRLDPRNIWEEEKRIRDERIQRTDEDIWPRTCNTDLMNMKYRLLYVTAFVIILLTGINQFILNLKFTRTAKYLKVCKNIFSQELVLVAQILNSVRSYVQAHYSVQLIVHQGPVKRNVQGVYVMMDCTGWRENVLKVSFNEF